jgi:hypothetical protein
MKFKLSSIAFKNWKIKFSHAKLLLKNKLDKTLKRSTNMVKQNIGTSGILKMEMPLLIGSKAGQKLKS